jgi:hypothetical protein
MTIEGSVQVAGFIAPTAPTDVYPTHDATYGMDGWRSVADSIERNAIPDERRRQGMMVAQQDTGDNWQLKAGPWVHTDSDWSITTATPTGVAGGDLAGSYPNPTLAVIGSATGPIGSTTVVPVVTIDAKGRVTALTSATLPTSYPPNGSAGGDLAGSYPNPTLAVIGSATGPIGASATIPVITIDAKGRVTALTSVTAVIPLLNGTIVYVDSIYGNDSTGARERFDLPFLTIAAARTAAIAGDLIYIRPGSYNIGGGQLSKAGISVYAPPGVTISYSGFIFGNIGNSTSFSMYGEADFICTSTGRLIDMGAGFTNQSFNIQFRNHSCTTLMSSAIRMDNTGNAARIYCRNLQVQCSTSSIVFGNGLFSSGTLFISVEENYSNTDPTSGANIIQARNSSNIVISVEGTLSTAGGPIIDGLTFGGGNVTQIRADTISAAQGLLNGGSGTYNVTGRVLSSSGNAAAVSGGTLNLVGFSSISAGGSGFLMTGGTVNLTGSCPTLFAGSGAAISLAGGAVFNGHVDTITGTSAGISIAGGSCFVVAARSIFATTGPAIDVPSGATTSTIITPSASTSGTNTPAVRMTGGTNVVRVTGARLTGNGTAPAVQRDIAGGALVLRNCVALPGVSAINSFTAAVPTDIIAVAQCSSNLGEDANTTFRVNALNVSTFVQ